MPICVVLYIIHLLSILLYSKVGNMIRGAQYDEGDQCDRGRRNMRGENMRREWVHERGQDET
jgi:hypothetical protein